MEAHCRQLLQRGLCRALLLAVQVERSRVEHSSIDEICWNSCGLQGGRRVEAAPETDFLADGRAKTDNLYYGSGCLVAFCVVGELTMENWRDTSDSAVADDEEAAAILIEN